MKYRVRATTAYARDYKKALKRHLPIAKLQAVVAKLANGESLPPQVEPIQLKVQLGRQRCRATFSIVRIRHSRHMMADR